MEPTDCLRCGKIFDKDPVLRFRVRDMLLTSGSDEARAFINEYLAADHARHEQLTEEMNRVKS